MIWNQTQAGGQIDPMSSINDIEDWIGRMALGDRAAFTSIYSATSAKLFGVVLRILNDRAEAEDVLQEVFVKIWRNADRYAAGGYSPMTWLIAIARNQAIDRIRARKPRSEAIDEAFQLADQTPGPEAQTIAASERRLIDGCLGELDDAKAGAVRGAYLEGYSYEELSAHFDVPLNTMRTWLRRSLMKLKECLER